MVCYPLISTEIYISLIWLFFAIFLNFFRAFPKSRESSLFSSWFIFLVTSSLLSGRWLQKTIVESRINKVILVHHQSGRSFASWRHFDHKLFFFRKTATDKLTNKQLDLECLYWILDVLAVLCRKPILLSSVCIFL